MKIAHFSDTHLGYSRFPALDARGFNQRMVDVVETFERVLADILEANPDVVVHSGDFFDSSRPPNIAITAAYRRIARFQDQREGKPLLIASGNHDSPKSIGVGNILTVFGEAEESSHAIPGVRVFESRAARVEFPDIGFEALVLPWSGENPGFAIEPLSRSNVSLLVAHGLEMSLGVPGATLSLTRMAHEKWSYVALGDYHIRKELAPNVWYSGSTEYTSTNFWDEINERKGWLLYDSETRAVTPKFVEPVRPAILLPPIDAAGMTGSEIGESLERNFNWDVSLRPIVRQVVRNCDPRARAEVPPEVFHTLRQACLFYDHQLQLAPKASDQQSGEEARGSTLQEDWEGYAAQRHLPLGIERDEYIGAGLRWMKEAEGAAPAD